MKDRAAAAAEGMLLAWWAAKGPDRPAVITAYGNRTFGELNANINRLVRALRARGLTPGDSVALMCTNRPEFLEVLYAAQRSGLAQPLRAHRHGHRARWPAECEHQVTAADPLGPQLRAPDPQATEDPADPVGLVAAEREPLGQLDGEPTQLRVLRRVGGEAQRGPVPGEAGHAQGGHPW